jgi:hypothetical protein
MFDPSLMLFDTSPTVTADGTYVTMTDDTSQVYWSGPRLDSTLFSCDGHLVMDSASS